jgi:hypothetical protein
MSIIKKHSGKKVDIFSATAHDAKKPATTTVPPSLKGVIRKAKNGTPTLQDPAIQVSSTTSKRRKYCVASQPENQNRTWDPGGNPDPEWRNKLIKINVSSYIYSLLADVLVSDVDVADDNMMDVEEASRTELDSHANMPVVGRHAYTARLHYIAHRKSGRSQSIHTGL